MYIYKHMHSYVQIPVCAWSHLITILNSYI